MSNFRTQMSLALIQCLLITVVFVSTIRADILTGTTVFSFAPNPSVGLNLSVDTSTDLADIVLSGRSDGWFSVGFGRTDMDGTYAIVIDQFGLPSEYRLGNFGTNTLLTSTVSTISSSIDSGTRTVRLQRSRDLGVAFPDHFVFPTMPGEILLAGATGPGAFGYHLNRDGGAVTLSAIPEPSAVWLVSAIGGVAFLRLRSRSSS